MATTPELHEPQIAAAREKAWHQASNSSNPNGSKDPSASDFTANPLLTLEAAREFITGHGLVLFAPRPLGAPAPSLVEATLGIAKTAPTLAETDIARTLVARLVGEGSALPLNLLGGAGELPDFVVSTSAFPFVFTLRGDKGWKRPPETSGAVKVTPLALRVYELLSERGAMTVAGIVSEVGREVTESAIARSLNELWALLRVIPVLQQGEGETQWELLTARFMKAVKAGANAGQPTALSALVSLYLGQVFIASEEEIASFLSPLTARSRVREVLHGLIAGRQLGEAVLDGKSVLYIPDALPDFAQFAAAEEGESVDSTSTESNAAPEQGAEGEGRIRRFDAGADGGRPRAIRGKPAAREGGFRSGPRPGTRTGPRPGPRTGPRPAGDRPRTAERGPRAEGGASRGYKGATDRPARSRDGEAPRTRTTGDRPSFARPWDEDRASRPPREAGDARPDRPARPRTGDDSRPPRREGTEGRPYRPARPRDDSRPPRREGGSDRPPFRREGGSDRPPFRREAGSDRPAPRGDRRPPAGDRPERRTFGAGADRPRSSRPPSDRPYVKREGFSSERSAPRQDGDRPRPERSGGERSGSSRPSFDRPRPGAGFRSEGRPGRDSGQGFSRAPGGRPPFRGGAEGRPAGDRPARSGDGPAGRPARASGGYGARSGAGSAGGRGGFAGGPKRGAPPKGAPRGGSAAGPSRGRPAPRKRPEDEG